MQPLYDDRRQAGRLLGARLAALPLATPRLVLALPRGGVPVGLEVAHALHAPLEVLLVRKIGVPWQPELAVAALVEGDPPALVVDEEVQRSCAIEQDYLDHQVRLQRDELAHRRKLYRQGRPLPAMKGHTVVLVDDGIATGTSVRAALQALRRCQPAHLVLAVPVAAAATVTALQDAVELLVCLNQPADFQAIGPYYRDFHQLDDEEVLAALREAAAAARAKS